MLSHIWAWAEEGQQHGIPLCCCLRFGLSKERPRLLPSSRLLRRLAVFGYSPRDVFAYTDAQGYIPCEYHLMKWVLTGVRPDIRQDDGVAGEAPHVSGTHWKDTSVGVPLT